MNDTPWQGFLSCSFCPFDGPFDLLAVQDLVIPVPCKYQLTSCTVSDYVLRVSYMKKGREFTDRYEKRPAATFFNLTSEIFQAEDCLKYLIEKMLSFFSSNTLEWTREHPLSSSSAMNVHDLSAKMKMIVATSSVWRCYPGDAATDSVGRKSNAGLSRIKTEFLNIHLDSELDHFPNT
jgi:hypothetical protein